MCYFSLLKKWVNIIVSVVQIKNANYKHIFVKHKVMFSPTLSMTRVCFQIWTGSITIFKAYYKCKRFTGNIFNIAISTACLVMKLTQICSINVIYWTAQQLLYQRAVMIWTNVKQFSNEKTKMVNGTGKYILLMFENLYCSEFCMFMTQSIQ